MVIEAPNEDDCSYEDLTDKANMAAVWQELEMARANQLIPDLDLQEDDDVIS